MNSLRSLILAHRQFLRKSLQLIILFILVSTSVRVEAQQIVVDDIQLSERFVLLGEIAALNFDNFFYQGGFRMTLIPDLLEMDFTYGEGFRSMETAPGLKYWDNIHSGLNL